MTSPKQAAIGWTGSSFIVRQKPHPSASIL